MHNFTTNNVKNQQFNMGYKLMTSRTRVSCHNHWTWSLIPKFSRKLLLIYFIGALPQDPLG